MSCNCNKSICENGKKKAIKGGSHQLKKKVLDANNQEREENVYPITLLENIVDSYTEKSLMELLFMNNHLYFQLDNSFECTVRKVPKAFRRLGLYVTIVSPANSFETYVYIGNKEIICSEWMDKNNWKNVSSSNQIVEGGDIDSILNRIKNIEETKIQIKSITLEQYNNLSREEQENLSVIYYIRDI